ncbi:HNH endonuclease [Promicromonospora kroppenstedtii]|uniref:HNH endonuclease n=1 Tax=Promicromonospora kroppenstedtii TaxID=440482 RepID=UPI0012F9FD0D
MPRGSEIGRSRGRQGAMRGTPAKGGRGSSQGGVWSGRVVTSARAHWRTRLPQPCYLCGKPVLPTQRWVVEHMVPRSQGGSLTARSNQWVSHRTCSDSSGGQLAQSKRKANEAADRREFRDWTR